MFVLITLLPTFILNQDGYNYSHFCSTHSQFRTCITDIFEDCVATIDNVQNEIICPEGPSANVDGCSVAGYTPNGEPLSDFTTLQRIMSPNFGNPSYIGNSISR